MKTTSKSTRPKRATQPEFVRKAGRALRRAAAKVREENQRLGLPMIGWRDGKVVEIPTVN